MHYKRRPLLLSVRKQWAVFLLAVLLLGLQWVYHATEFKTTNPTVAQSSSYQLLLDSVRSRTTIKKKNTFPFNPNYLSDYRAYRLGMRPPEIDRLLVYREKGKFINSANEFQRVTKIHDTLLARLSPYFRFPLWVTEQQQKKVAQNGAFQKKDLNTAGVLDFKSIRGIGSTLAARIVKYRSYLQGFSNLEQCYEVYGLDSVVVQQLLNRFEIKTGPKIVKISMNTISLQALQGLPYISNEDARKIIGLRTQRGVINEVYLRDLFKEYPKKINRIMLYLF